MGRPHRLRPSRELTAIGRTIDQTLHQSDTSPMTPPARDSKLSIVGAGSVGSSLAYARLILVNANTGNELPLLQKWKARVSDTLPQPIAK